MSLDWCFNIFPTCTGQWYMYLFGILGAVLLIYSQFVEAENRRDLIRLLGAGGLFVYAYFIQNMIFLIAMGGISIAALIEFVEIYLGMHKHLPMDLRHSIEHYGGLGDEKKTKPKNNDDNETKTDNH